MRTIKTKDLDKSKINVESLNKSLKDKKQIYKNDKIVTK